MHKEGKTDFDPNHLLQLLEAVDIKILTWPEQQ